MKPKNVLIPTDFTVHSLDLIVAAVRQFEGEALHITLLHALAMPDMMDLLFLSRNNDRYKLITKEFGNACAIIKNRYASVIRNIQVQFMHGSTKAVFRNVVEASKAAVLVYPTDYVFQKPSNKSIDISKLFKHAGCERLEVNLKKLEADVRKIKIADLLMAVS